jgi:hypothetical protein
MQFLTSTYDLHAPVNMGRFRLDRVCHKHHVKGKYVSTVITVSTVIAIQNINLGIHKPLGPVSLVLD